MTTTNSQDDSEADPDGHSIRRERFAEWFTTRWGRFDDWRRQRPFLGGVLLCLAGIVITWVPMQILPDIIFIGGQMAGILTVGAMFGVFVFLTGAFALSKPAHSDVIGVIGVVLSIFSLFGALGGLFVGMILGILGGNLCIAWKPDDEVDGDVTTEPSMVDRAIARVRTGVRRVVGSVRRIVGKSIPLLHGGTERVTQRGIDE